MGLWYAKSEIIFMHAHKHLHKHSALPPSIRTRLRAQDRLMVAAVAVVCKLSMLAAMVVVEVAVSLALVVDRGGNGDMMVE